MEIEPSETLEIGDSDMVTDVADQQVHDEVSILNLHELFTIDYFEGVRLSLNEDWFFKNPCGFKPINLFQDVEFPLISPQPIFNSMDISQLSFDTCETIREPVGTSYSDVRLEKVQLK